MKFIKSYKIFESKNISLKSKLKKFDISDYQLNENGSIDVNEDVDLVNADLNEIPFKFNKIYGFFIIYDNYLESLKNCPKWIEQGFNCSNNQLTSLEFGPEYANGEYYCDRNKLITLKGCIDEIEGSFSCNNNKLTSLEFCPMEVGGDFDCSSNKLEYLDRSPLIKGDLYCCSIFKTKPEFNGSCKNLIWK